MQACELPVISGTFFRIVYAEHATDSLQGARSPEGRFHHDGEPALYMSSRPDWALKAVEAYLRPGDPPRVTVPLALGVPLIWPVDVFRLRPAGNWLGATTAYEMIGPLLAVIW